MGADFIIIGIVRLLFNKIRSHPPFIPLLAGSSLRFPSFLPSSERASGGEGRGEGRSDHRPAMNGDNIGFFSPKVMILLPLERSIVGHLFSYNLLSVG